MITSLDLATYLGAIDDSLVQDCLDQAVALVDAYIGDAVVPDVIVDRAYLEAGQELFNRKDAPNGITQFATLDGTGGLRVARDPLVGVYPLLALFVPGGFA